MASVTATVTAVRDGRSRTGADGSFPTRDGMDPRAVGKPGGGGATGAEDAGSGDRPRRPVQPQNGHRRSRTDARRRRTRSDGASSNFPSIKRLRVGERVKHGLPGYEQMMSEDFEFAAIIEFDDRATGFKSICSIRRTEPLARHFAALGVAALGVRLRSRGIWLTSYDTQSLISWTSDEKKSSIIARSCAIDSAALIATRRCDPLSSPLVYQEFNARSLLITQRS